MKVDSVHSIAARLDELAVRRTRRYDGARAMVKARMFPTPPLDENRIGGRYVVGKILGRGGFGTVCLAQDVELERPIALKLLHRGRIDDATLGRHDVLAGEARSLARVNHPNVVTVFDVGVSNGRTYLAMEYVPGPNLRRFLGDDHPPAKRLQLLLQAGRGLVAAHAAGIVHRDFKPENVLVGLDGRVRVGDFGLARTVAGMPTDEEDGAATVDGKASRFAGTPVYMAPELLDGHVADARSDQYAFFVAVYEAAYGRRPYAAQSIDILRTLASRGPKRIETPPDVPARLFDVIERGLHPDPERRYPNMRTALRALTAALEPRRRPAMWLALVGVPIGALGLHVSLPDAPTSNASARCASGADVVAHVWTEARRQQVWRATIASGRPHAIAAWPRVEDRIDRFAAAWAREHATACEVPVRVDTTTLDCLARRSDDLDAVLTVLARRGSELCSADLLRLLGSPTRCRDGRGAGIEGEDFVALVERAADVGALVCGYTRDEAALAEVKAFTATAEGHPAASSAAWALLGSALDQVRGTDAAAAAHEQAYARADPDDTPNRVAAATSLAIMRAQTDIADAQRWASEATSLAERSGDLEDRCQAAVAVARTSMETADVRGAERKALDAIEMCGRDSVDAGELYGVLAAITAQEQRLVEARQWAELRRELDARNRGREDPRYALAELSVGLASEPGMARDSITRAVTLLERTLGSQHRLTAWARSRLAVVEMEDGHFERAREILEPLWEIEKRRPARDNPSFRLHYLNALAQVYGRLGERELELEMHQRASDHALEWLGDHPLLGAALSNTAGALRRMQRYDEALVRFDQAIDVMERLLGTSAPMLAYPLAGRAHTLADLGREDEALPGFERALAIAEAGDDDLAAAVIAGHVAIRLPESERARALALAEQALPELRTQPERYASTIASLERFVGG
jgi:tetratricopeptide (TPR) repeat protein